MIKCGNGDIDPLRPLAPLKEELGTAAGCKRSKPACMPDLPQLPLEKLNGRFPDRPPGDERRTTRPATVNTVTILRICRHLVEAITHSVTQTTTFDGRVHVASFIGVARRGERYFMSAATLFRGASQANSPLSYEPATHTRPVLRHNRNQAIRGTIHGAR